MTMAMPSAVIISHCSLDIAVSVPLGHFLSCSADKVASGSDKISPVTSMDRRTRFDGVGDIEKIPNKSNP